MPPVESIPPSSSSSFNRHAALYKTIAVLLLLAFTVWARSPLLVNADAINTDAAIVALQARHMLNGEWSLYIWGAGYQSSIDAVIAAGSFAIFGPNTFTMIAIPVAAYLLMVWIIFITLQKRVGTGSAFFAMLPVVFATYPVNHMLLGVSARHWAYAQLAFAIWMLDGAADSRRSLLRYAGGAWLGVAALYIDLIAIQFMPGLAAFALACCFDNSNVGKSTWRRLRACAAGSVVGLVIVIILRHYSGTTGGTLEASWERIGENGRLLFNACLPWLLGIRTYIQASPMNFRIWDSPAAFQWLQIVGMVIFTIGLAFGAMAVFLRRLPWKIRRLSGLAALTAISSLGAFLISQLPGDPAAARYLSPIILTAPFALAPAAHLLGTKRFAIAILPFVISTAVAGWVSLHPFINGPLPARVVRIDEEMTLRDELRRRDIQYAAAHVWLSYRLTFLFDEDPIVVPFLADQDRYAPYRKDFSTAKTVAAIFHPSEPRATPEPYGQWLHQKGTRSRYGRIQIGGFTVLIVYDRDP